MHGSESTPYTRRLHYQLAGSDAADDKVLLIMGFACCKSYWNQWGSQPSFDASPLSSPELPVQVHIHIYTRLKKAHK